MRKWIPRVAFLLVVLAVGSLVTGWLAIDPMLRNQIEAAGTRGTGVLMTVRSVESAPFDGSATLEGLALANPGGLEGAIFEAPLTTVKADLGTLLADEIRLTSVVVDGGTLWLALRNGRLNVTELRERLADASDRPADGTALAVADLRVRGVVVRGEVALPGLPPQAVHYQLPDLHQTGLQAADLGDLMRQVADTIADQLTAELGKAAPSLAGLLNGVEGAVEAAGLDPAGAAGAVEEVERTVQRLLDGVSSVFDALEDQPRERIARE